jgi:hypothetical protein
VRTASGYPGYPDRAPGSLLADLDAILGKALEKPRELRYPTAAAFAEDLRRLLRREPIEARAPTIGYRAALRPAEPRLVAAASLALAALIVGVVGPRPGSSARTWSAGKR